MTTYNCMKAANLLGRGHQGTAAAVGVISSSSRRLEEDYLGLVVWPVASKLDGF